MTPSSSSDLSDLLGSLAALSASRTPAMLDSLAYRNDAAIVLRRQVRSLPTRQEMVGLELFRQAAQVARLHTVRVLPCALAGVNLTHSL